MNMTAHQAKRGAWRAVRRTDSMRRMALAGLALALCGTAARGTPAFRVDKIYPEMGLKMRVLGSSDPVALPQPKTYTYTARRGGETIKQDRFDPHELWYASQHCGHWKDAKGNTLTIGRVATHAPQFSDEHVQREQYEATMNEPAAAVDANSEEALLRWVWQFTKCRPESVIQLHTSANFGLHSAIFVTVSGGEPLVWLFRVSIRTPSGRNVPSEWFCAVLTLPSEDDTDKARKAFESQFLANVAAAPRAYTTSAPAISSRELQTTRGESSQKIPDSPARAAAIKSIASMQYWWFAETPEYIFLSDIRSSEGKSLVRQLQHEMPHLRNAFTRLIPPLEPITEASVVRIFENPDAYKQYVGDTLEWSIGAWSPMRRELIILSQGRDMHKTMEIIRHEGLHQYLFHACSMLKTSAWFNEGHACLFECAAIDRQGRVDIQENSRVQHLLSNLDSAAAGLPDLLRMDYDVFYAPNAGKRSLNYTTAWALVYFLHKGAPLEKPNIYRDVVKNYLTALQRTRNPDQATSTAFEGIGTAKLQEDFTEFWKRKRNRAHRYDPLAN